MIALLTACLLFRNPYARAELHQQKHTRKLCSATLNIGIYRDVDLLLDAGRGNHSN